ncbi:MAG: DNA topoisomerase IV subunit B [Gammaproteobacteria bacterium]|nr:DNA topoisomerase IV subunit B [Gammaproteobacteria bacterium]
MSRSYQSKDIEVLEGLDPVRKRPGMYTDTSRPNHLAHEVIDNSIDEALAGHCKNIEVILHDDGSLEVSDDGRGMPVDKHPKEKVPGVELILSRLHSGGKFSNKQYQYAGGLHGVGVSVVNALSEKLEVWVQREGKRYHMAFANGKRKSALKSVGKVGQRNTGTRLRFWPNAKYFDTVKFAAPKIKNLLQAKAVLCPGLTLTFIDEAKGKEDSWHYEEGMAGYLAEQLGKVATIPETSILGNHEDDGKACDWAVAWTPEADDPVRESYVNLIPTAQAGTHVNGLRSGLTDAVREFCEFRKLIPRGVKITPDDVWDDVNFIFSYKTQNPQFAGQTKERFASKDASAFVSGVIKDAFSLWLNEHAATGEQLATHVIARAQARQKTAKKVTRKRAAHGPSMPAKLADCLSDEMNESELFLVEGDSAGGSARQARDKETQAVMPLRGKILNTWEVDSASVLSNQEVHDISIAIGVQPGEDDISGLRYSKICILADADADGLHIATLLTALFLKHYRPLVEAGHIYVSQPPLFRVDAGKEMFYAADEKERDKVIAKIRKAKPNIKISVMRFKGLGEMNPKQLRVTTMAPKTRRLAQLVLEKSKAADEMLDMLLAKKRSADRRGWLESKGDLVQL